MKYFDNHFLFSETYIKNYINESNKKSAAKDETLLNMFTNVVEWNREYINGDYSSDPWEFYIDAVLDVLGFENREAKNNIRVLYTNPIASGVKAVAICYGIDRKEDVSSIEKGKYFAYNAVKAARENDVDWAILTNGYKWRIYDAKNISPYENYLEVDIEASINVNSSPNDAFKLFNLFFNVKTYFTEDGELKIEKIKDQSDKTAETIEEFLRGKAEEILKDLCYGFKENMGKQVYTEEDRKNIYNDAIILLYRLLFFGYAESRGLLPITSDDPNYPDSFEKLCFDAKEVINKGQLAIIREGFEFWERLDSHLRVYVDNSYNGGLFHNEDKPVLKEHRIANEHLVKCLAEISHNKDKNDKYTTEIQYKDLSVRNLGAIYEGLLEYRLFIAEERMVQRKNKNKVTFIKAAEITLKDSDKKAVINPGGIYLSQDALERKETGAYYTPEDVVEYIVDNTIGKKLRELKQELKERLKPQYEELQYEPTELGKRRIQNEIDSVTLEFINEKILTLSIIDSAMGSGHFLVNAAYRVSNEIVSIIADNDWQSMDEVPVDIKEWKRKVVENCIYGIDINELSVALARLSLWLISADNDKALSFIDHHLKTGDSIIGATKSQVKHVTDEKLIQMFDVLPEAMLEPVINKFNKIKEIGSSTKYDVEVQKDIYEQIERELNLIKKKFDYYLSTKYAGGITDEKEYIDLMRFGTLDDFEKPEIKPLMQYARDNKFFHWELEFPQVFEKGGFDIAIGNPPYVDVELSKYKAVNLKTYTCRNLYAYMIEKNIDNIIMDGFLGVIVPLSIISTPRMKEVEYYVIDHNETCISSYAIRPSKIFRNVDQRVSIILGKKSKKPHCILKTSKYNRWYKEERKTLFSNINYVNCERNYILDGRIPKIGSEVEGEILNKIFSKENRLSDLFISTGENKIYYHSAARYWIKSLDFIPEFYSEKKGNSKSSEYKEITLNSRVDPKIVGSIINSTLFFWFWSIYSDDRHVNKSDIGSIMFDYSKLDDNQKIILVEEFDNLMRDYRDNSTIKECNYSGIGKVRYQEFRPKNSKKIIDKIDEVLGLYYGFTQQEIEFIKNYDIKFRLGEEE